MIRLRIMKWLMYFLGRWFYGLRPDIMRADLFPAGRCWNCGRLTHYIDVDFEAFLCSNRCNRQKWNELAGRDREIRGGQ